MRGASGTLRLRRQGRQTPGWVAEWEQAAALDRLEAERTDRESMRIVLAGLAALAAAVGAVAYGRLAPGLAVAPAAFAAAVVALAAVAVPFISARVRARAVTLVAGVASVGAAVIHFAVAPMHLNEYRPFGLLFLVVGLAQFAWGVAVVRWPSPLFLVAGALVSVGVIAVWVLSRTWGLPLGPDPGRPEAVGAADALCSGLELVIACCFVLLFARRQTRGSSTVAATAAVVMSTATVVALLSAVGAASSLIPPAA